MTFSEEEVREIQALALKHPIIYNLWEDYQRITNDNTAKFYTALNRFIGNYADDLNRKMDENDSINIDSVMDIASKGDKIFNTMARGRADVFKEKAEAAEEEAGGSLIDRKANRGRNSH